MTEIDNMEEMIEALAKHLECNADDIILSKYDHYGLSIFLIRDAEYAVGVDGDVEMAVTSSIKDSLWAFNASFILEQCGLPGELESAIKAMQEKECEGCNDAILGMIEKFTTLQSFMENAIRSDGRGHFLSQYDGEENEEGDFFIYRLN